jgi:hypothetical protein
MNTITAKFVLPAVLVVTICALGVSVGYAFETTCTYTKGKKTAFCSNDDPDDNTVWRCDKRKNGTWHCDALPKEKMTSAPTALSDALNKARIAAKKKAAP